MSEIQTLRERPKQSPGIVTIKDDEVIWHSEDLGFTKLNLSDVVIVGEYTNSAGPWFNDWFITFVTKEGKWFSIPWYADNIDELTNLLSVRCKTDFNISYLNGSTSWNSLVRYPASLKGKPLFILTPSETYKEPRTILDKILSALGFGNFDTTKDIHLTDDVKNEIRNAGQ